jgi:hypothetical protein
MGAIRAPLVLLQLQFWRLWPIKFN